MAAINFPTATADGQTFEADTGVIYTYNGTPPNGFWSGSFQTTGIDALDAKYILQDDGGSVQTIKRSGLKINDNSNDTILLNSDGSASFDGDVGIGTTSANVALSVHRTSENAGLELTRGTVGSEYGYRLFGSDGATAPALKFFPVSNGTLGSEKMRIDSSGRLLIGTTTEGHGNAEKLTVAHTTDCGITIRSGSVNAGSLFFSDSTSGTAEYAGYFQYDHSSNSFAIGTAATERLRIDSSGRVGIGSTAPGHTLEVKGSFPDFAIVDSDTTNDKFRILHNGGATQIQVDPNNVGPNASYFLVSIDNTERMRIDSSGNVGIGTTSPEEILHIAAASELVSSRDGVMLQSTSSLAADTGLPIVFTSHIGSIANYGVASIAGRKENATSGNAAGYLQFATGTAAGALTERMRIDSSGRLLVGTTSSSAKTTSVFEGNSTVGTGDARLILALGGNAPANDTLLGILRFTDTSHSTANTSAADITVARDGGTWTSGSSMPGRLVFSTTADGASSPTERLRIDSSGNVGIGTSPSYKLHVEGSINAYNGFLRIAGTSSPSGNDPHLYRPASGAMGFWTGGDERMRLDSDGRLLLGTTTEGQPDADNFTIEDSGNCGISIRSGTTSNGNIFFADATSGVAEYRGAIRYYHNDDALTFYSSSSERMRIDSSGNVGIGTTSPSERLHVYHPSGNVNAVIESGDANAYLSFKDSSTTSTAHVYLGAEGDEMKFASNGAERMRIDSSGNVGIGTSSPGRKLTINHNGESFIQIRSSDTGNAGVEFGDQSDAVQGSIFFNATDNSLRFNGYNNAERMRIDSSGRVLIGVTSNYANPNCDDLVVGNADASGTRGITIGGLDGGQIAFADSADARAGILLYNHSDSSMRFYTSGASNERMRILADGGLTFNGDTAQANALDDYEEGEFVATVTGKTNNTQLTLNTSRDRMRYIKVGNKVTIFGRIQITATNGATGALRFGGLPFANDANGTDESDYNALQVTWHGFDIPSDGTGQVFIELTGGNTAADLLYLRDNTGWAQLNVTALNYSAGVYLYISGSYYSA